MPSVYVSDALHCFSVISKKGLPKPENGKSVINPRRSYEVIAKLYTDYPQIFRGHRAVYDGKSNMYHPYDILHEQNSQVVSFISFYLSLYDECSIENLLNVSSSKL